jgi:hypothetical protein
MRWVRRFLVGIAAAVCALAGTGGAGASSRMSPPAPAPTPAPAPAPAPAPTPAPAPAPAPAAGCQSASFVTVAFELTSGARLVSERNLPVCLTGSATVSFHGSRLAGCGSHGLCQYAGTETWRPEQGTLSILVIADHGRRRTLQMFTPGGSAPLAGIVRRRVGGRVSGTCRDSGVPSVVFPPLRGVHDGRARLELPRGGVDTWPSLCAGPLASHLPPFPAISLSVARALRGTAAATVDRSRNFSGGGFAGTVAEHLTVTTGQPENGGGAPSPAVRKRRYRTVTLTYRIQSPIGSVAVDWDHATAGCTELDACGLQGRERVGVSEPASDSTLQISAEATARRPKRDLLAALGLSRRGDPKGIGVVGELRPRSDLSTTAVGHGVRCRDGRAVGPPTAILISGSRGRLTASYTPLFEGDPLRTSCPGPALGAHALASATLAPGALAARRVTLSFTRPETYDDHGYAVHLAPQLSLALTRERVTQRVRELVVANGRGAISDAVGPAPTRP